jgi:hypothetical protein
MFSSFQSKEEDIFKKKSVDSTTEMSRYRDGLKLDGRGSIPARGKIFLYSGSVQTSSGAHRTSYSVGSGSSFGGSKAAVV